MYAAENWTLKQTEMAKIEAFEMWVWRRMLQISWKERKSNAWIRQKIGVPRDEGLLAQLKKRKLSMYGHWKRRPESLTQMTIEGEVELEGKATRMPGQEEGKQDGLITSEHGLMAE